MSFVHISSCQLDEVQRCVKNVILQTNHEENLFHLFDSIGMKNLAYRGKRAIIKVNIARPPEKDHPRTSPRLISKVVEYLSAYGVQCTIAEAADGYLEENVRSIGLDDLVKKYHVDLLDLDFADTVSIAVDDEEHHIPKCFNEYHLRIAIPATSKRPNMIFSNNIKLFVGAVPRRLYQIGDPVRWRPKIHLDLHKSVANIYKAIMLYAPFHFYINGGTAFDETKGEYEMPAIFVGNDGLELDLYILKKYFTIEIPDYMKRLLHHSQGVEETPL